MIRKRDALALLLSNKNTSQLGQIANKMSSDFISTTENPGFVNRNINGGYASENGSVDEKHPGVLYYASTTTADSGAGYMSNDRIIIVGEGYEFSMIFMVRAKTGLKRYSGFHDTINSQMPTDGVFFTQDGGVAEGNISVNSVNIKTTTSFTMSANTFYRMKISVLSDGAKFTLYEDGTDIVLWEELIEAALPSAKIGVGDIATYDVAAVTYIGEIDYMEAIFPNRRLK